MLKRLLKPTAFKLALFIGVAFAAFHFVHQQLSPQVFPFRELDLLDAKAMDFKMQRRGPVKSSGRVVIAGVDEASVKRYGLWPWRRPLVAKGLKNLNDAGALAIGVDIAFSDPDRSSPHLAINRLIEGALSKTQLGDGAPPTGEGVMPAVAKDAAPEANRLKDLRDFLAGSRVEDPDAVFASMLEESPRVVVGVFSLTADEVSSMPVAAREENEALLAPFTISDVFTRVKTVGSDGAMKADLGPHPSLKPADLRGHIHTFASLQAPLPVIARAAKHLGSFDTSADSDGVMRRYPLVSLVGDRFFPSLAAATVATALDADVCPFPASEGSPSLGLVRFRARDAGGILKEEAPVDSGTGAMLINYPGPKDGALDGHPLFERLSFADAVDNTFDPAKVKDKIVFVGMTAIGTFDQRVSPFDSYSPGVLVHAAVADNILTGDTLQREASFTLLEMALMLVIAVVFGLTIPRLGLPGQLGAMLFGSAFFMGGVDYGFFFKRGLVFNSVTTVLEIATLCFGMIAFSYFTTDREKRQVRHAFQHYLTKSVMEEMLKNPDKLKLGGDKRELTVLFSDIRGFTTISERLPPEELVRTLNEYLTPMTNLVFKHEGTLDKYMGDAVMAFWGAPLSQEDHALRACTCAVEMLKELADLRKRWRAEGRPDIDIGVGLNSGLMAVGNMGSDSRFDYTVMGDNVNLGSRLEGTNKEYGTNIIISEFTHALVKGRVVARELGSVRVKGKKKPVGIFELRGVGTPSAEEAKVIALFEEGIAAYRARKWDEAEALFRQVTAAWADDGPSGKYLEDIDHKRKDPPPEGWDGVYEMKTK